MSALAEKARKAREKIVTRAGHRFTFLRPTDADMARLHGKVVDPINFICQFVVGWDLQEMDLYSGGTGIEVGFEADAFAEWLADHPDAWELSADIKQSFADYTAAKEETEKN